MNTFEARLAISTSIRDCLLDLFYDPDLTDLDYAALEDEVDVIVSALFEDLGFTVLAVESRTVTVALTLDAPEGPEDSPPTL